MKRGKPNGPKRRVVIVFGGRSAEHEVSVASARSVAKALGPDRYEVLLIGIDKLGRWHQMNELPSRREGAGALPGVTGEEGPGVSLARDSGGSAIVTDRGERTEIEGVFLSLHGPNGEDGTIQGILELASVHSVAA